MTQRSRVLIVDDVPLVRSSIADIVEAMSGYEVAGEAGSGVEALRMVNDLQPDLVTLDILMPGMNGITALKHVMINNPVPTVMISSVTQEGADLAFDSIRFGAVDFLPKLSKLDEVGLDQQREEIMTKLRWAADVRVESIRYIPARVRDDKQRVREEENPELLITIGAAQGGYASLMRILPHLGTHPGVSVLVVLYENASYVEAFAAYVNRYTRLEVRRATDGAHLSPGICYISPGSDYVTLRHAESGGASLHVHPAPFESQKGSFNRLLYSATDMLGDRVVGLLLSGAGDDGAEGLAEVQRVGGHAMVQDPATCLVAEMAETAIRYCSDGELVVSSRPLDVLLELEVALAGE